MNAPRRRAVALTGAAALTLAGGLAWWVAPALRRAAQRTATTQTPLPPSVLLPGGPGSYGVLLGRAPSYVWLSPETVLFLPQRPLGKAVSMNTRTGRETPFPLRFDPFLGTPPLLSPNGRRLLWSEGSAAGTRLVAADVTGARRTVLPESTSSVMVPTRKGPGRRMNVSWRRGTTPGPFWLPDSSGWLRLVREPMMGRMRAETFADGPRAASFPPRGEPVAGFASRDDALGITGVNGKNVVVACSGGLRLGFGAAPMTGFLVPSARRRTAPGSVSAPPLPWPLWPAAKSANVTLTHFPIGSAGAPQRFPVALPAGTRSGTLTLSPRGDKIAWLLAGEPRVPLAQQLLRRLIPAPTRAPTPTGMMRVVTAPPPATLSLWVSRSDGSGLHRIADVSPESSGTSPARSHLRFSTFSLFGPFFNVVRWTPDQKRVSFVRDDELWSVPAR